MTYNLTAIGGLNQTFVGIVQVANDASNGILVGGGVIAIFIIQMVILSRFVSNTGEAATFSCWLCFFYSVFLTMAGLLNFYFMAAFLVGSAIGAYWLYYRG